MQFSSWNDVTNTSSLPPFLFSSPLSFVPPYLHHLKKGYSLFRSYIATQQTIPNSMASNNSNFSFCWCISNWGKAWWVSSSLLHDMSWGQLNWGWGWSIHFQDGSLTGLTLWCWKLIRGCLLGDSILFMWASSKGGLDFLRVRGWGSKWSSGSSKSF